MQKAISFPPVSILIVLIAASGTAVLGLLGLIGWHTHTTILLQIRPTYIAMVYNTALAFLLCGIGLVALATGWRRLALPCGSIVTTFGLLNLVQHGFAVDLGIDQLLLQPYLTTATRHPGRMALLTALCFVLAGTALLLMAGPTRFRQRPYLVAILGSLGAAVGITAFFGYLLGMKTYDWGRLVPMALPTAVGFIMLGVGLLACAWADGNSEEISASRWFPVPVGLGATTMTLYLWQALRAQDQGLLTPLGNSWLPEVTLGVGLVLTGLLVLAVSLAQMAWLRAQALVAVNQHLHQEITAHMRVKEMLRHQAFHDSLTSLPNRALFLDRLDHALVRAERHPTSVAVLFLDLDNFKVINDSLGHHTGDRILTDVAKRLDACVRPEDTVARLGGDEFTILLEDLVNASDAMGVAERLLAQLQVPLLLDGREIFPTASIGIALSTPGQACAASLLRDAAAAMSRAKHTGKAQYLLFDPSMHTHALERLTLETELRYALERGELRLDYQPIVDLATGEIGELEALVRWAHPQRGLVPPGQFIPLAEETGLILPIGRWVLAEAARQLRAWHEQYPRNRPLVVSVNLSTRQLQQPTLVAEIAHLLDETGLDPAGLKLELTESLMMQDPAGSIQLLRQLKALGIQLAIDDFGTGYSSLAYLKRLPLDTLKIDRSFVDGLGHDPEDTAIVQAIIRLAHTLHLMVTAEGIETALQVSLLQALGCEQGQGYYFAKPLVSEAISMLLAATPAFLSPGRQQPPAVGGDRSQMPLDLLTWKEDDARLSPGYSSA
jgi:diguanylate cyclase (GGDEF)-like protein